jgi:sulfite exporter TauE/SafE
LAAHLAILIVSAILGGVGNITDLANAGNIIFQIVTAIMLIIFAVKAWTGKPVHIEAVDDLTEWLENKIKPRN